MLGTGHSPSERAGAACSLSLKFNPWSVLELEAANLPASDLKAAKPTFPPQRPLCP